jgi:transitional endoplasmic reticulum ATPase
MGYWRLSFSMKKEFLELEVIESKQKYVGKGLVGISGSDLDRLNLISGDIVKIKSTESFYSRAIRVGETYSGTISLDGQIRSSLAVSIGDRVRVYPYSNIKKATKITLSILKNNEFDESQLKQFNQQLKSDLDNFYSKLLNNPVKEGKVISFDTNVGRLLYKVLKMAPKKEEVLLFTNETKIDVSDEIGEGSGASVFYEDIGGLKEEIEKIREMVEFPMRHPDLFEKLGIGAPKGVLLTGPPGTGKTLLAKAVATETDAKFISIAGPEIMSKYYGESEGNLRGKFEEAEKNAPAIIFIDEIDAIAPKRGESHDQTEKRIVTQLLTLMDGLKSRGQVVVMAATNRPEDLDEALRRPGRFDREIRINPPDEPSRQEILQIHTRNMPLKDRDSLLAEISYNTHGFTGADLEVLCKEAALRAVKPYYKLFFDSEGDDEKKKEILGKIIITKEHFIDAMRVVEPSAMREVLINKPKTKWSDVGGLKDAKDKLRELVELPLLRPDLFKTAGVKPSKGILLHGPPGSGKTLLAKAVANESNANFISVKGPELISKWVGESEKHVREIFKKAKQVAPSIIFFDEFDSISKSRGGMMSCDSSEKVVNQLLTELDGVEELENVILIAATNRKDLIDQALLRPGRIDSHVELTIPDDETRSEIFKIHTKNMPIAKNVTFEEYVKKTKDWTGADIEALCRDAGMNAIKKNYTKKEGTSFEVTKEDFEKGYNEIVKSLGLKKFDEKEIGNNKEKEDSLKEMEKEIEKMSSEKNINKNKENKKRKK